MPINIDKIRADFRALKYNDKTINIAVAAALYVRPFGFRLLSEDGEFYSDYEAAKEFYDAATGSVITIEANGIRYVANFYDDGESYFFVVLRDDDLEEDDPVLRAVTFELEKL